MRKAAWVAVVAVLVLLSFEVGRHRGSAGPGGTETPRRVLYYVDPMHPAYRSAKPGNAPDCGMALEPVYADAAGKEPVDTMHAAAPRGTVSIDPATQQLFGVRVVPVERTGSGRSLRVPGRVEADATRSYRINAGAEGWIRQTLDDSVGTFVKKDQKLATIYSPEFLVVESGFLAAIERNPAAASQQVERSNQNYADKLRNLGMSEMQMRELVQTRKLAESVYVVSPVDGFVTARKISPGEKFDRGAEFYRIDDLSRVWIVAQVFPDDAQYFPAGAVARVTVPGWKKGALQARVSSVLPRIDPVMRTTEIRLEADNPGFALRPDMFVDIELPVRMSPALTVPDDALLDTGLNTRVFVDRGNGLFEPRVVETGWRFGGRVEIVKGLEEGERVVASGTFLVDSESQLRSTAAGAPATGTSAADAGGAGGAGGTQAPPARATDPKCGKTVDPRAAAAAGNILTYHGVTYYFCSPGCKAEFQKQPERYTPANRGSVARD